MPFNASMSGSFGVQGRMQSTFLLGLTQQTAATSASQILLSNPSATDGWYWIKGSGTTAYYVYCAMKAGGWVLWMHWRETGSTAYTLGNIRTTNTTYNLTSDTERFLYTVPPSLLTGTRFIALNSNRDSNPTTPNSENDFKYVIEWKNSSGTVLDTGIYDWMVGTKNLANRYGLSSTTTSTRFSFNGNHKRYGQSFSTIQYGHNHGGGDEFETLNFRNADGTGAKNWTSYEQIWSYSGWGVIDGNSPNDTSPNTGYGSTGLDLTAYNGNPQLTDRLYAWFK